MLVVDIDALGISLSGAGDELEPIEKALESLAYEEWEEFRLVSRNPAVFDSLVSVLMALDREHHALLRRLLERCAAMSSEYIAYNGGLYEVLTSDEMLESDERAVRDERRAVVGHVAPSDAKSFLELARQGLGDLATRDPVTRAYFRELVRRDEPGTDPSELARLLALATGETLRARRRHPKAARKKFGNAASGNAASDIVAAAAPSLLEAALGELREHAPDSYAERMEELAYLTNVLVAAHAPGGRRLRPIEALELAVATCARGLDAALAETETSKSRDTARDIIATTPLDVFFRRAWRSTEHEPTGGARQGLVSSSG
jgi:hypothetical protein